MNGCTFDGRWNEGVTTPHRPQKSVRGHCGASRCRSQAAAFGAPQPARPLCTHPPPTAGRVKSSSPAGPTYAPSTLGKKTISRGSPVRERAARRSSPTDELAAAREQRQRGGDHAAVHELENDDPVQTHAFTLDAERRFTHPPAGGSPSRFTAASKLEGLRPDESRPVLARAVMVVDPDFFWQGPGWWRSP